MLTWQREEAVTQTRGETHASSLKTHSKAKRPTKPAYRGEDSAEWSGAGGWLYISTWLSSSAEKKKRWLHCPHVCLRPWTPCSKAWTWISAAEPNTMPQMLHLISPLLLYTCSMRWHCSFAGDSNTNVHSLHSWVVPSWSMCLATCSWISYSVLKDSWHLMHW